MKVSGSKHGREYKLHKNHANPLHTLEKWSITWSQFVLSGHSKHWLIRHSMMCTAIYSSCDSDTDSDCDSDCGSVKKTSYRSSSFHTNYVFIVTVII